MVLIFVLVQKKGDTESKDDESDLFDRAELNKNMVASIKSLREQHKLELPGRRQKDMTEIEESAMYGNGQLQNEGLYLQMKLINK
jgi:hypothetical protein